MNEITNTDKCSFKNIRLMTINDYDTVYALWLRTPGMGLNDIDDSCEGIEKYLQRNPTTSFIAAEDETVVGVILAGHDGRRGFIHHTCVDSNHRNKGIASQLVETALAALKTEEINKVVLVAFEHNKGGNAFWEHMGFTLRPDLTYRNKTLVELVRIDT